MVVLLNVPAEHLGECMKNGLLEHVFINIPEHDDIFLILYVLRYREGEITYKE